MILHRVPGSWIATLLLLAGVVASPGLIGFAHGQAPAPAAAGPPLIHMVGIDEEGHLDPVDLAAMLGKLSPGPADGRFRLRPRLAQLRIDRGGLLYPDA